MRVDRRLRKKNERVAGGSFSRALGNDQWHVSYSGGYGRMDTKAR